MPRYLGVALYAEGDTDYRFLTPLLARQIERLVLATPGAQVELGGPFPIDRAVDRETDIGTVFERIASASRSFDVLLLHRDGAGNSARERQRYIEPVLAEMTRLAARTSLVPVVPVREIEAWCLVDGEAIRNVTGATTSDAELGLQPLNRVERIADPKAELERVIAAAVGGPRYADDFPEYYTLLGEEVGLDRLAGLRAYQGFLGAMRSAITAVLAGTDQ